MHGNDVTTEIYKEYDDVCLGLIRDALRFSRNNNIVESLNEYISNINNFKILIEKGDKEKLSAEMKKINGIREILKEIK